MDAINKKPTKTWADHAARVCHSEGKQGLKRTIAGGFPHAKKQENTGKYANFEKNEKKRKKGVDTSSRSWYYNQARLRATNLENDTE
ncbi:MAG: hypothetical protein RSC91_07365 [Clostridia bacterium]